MSSQVRGTACRNLGEGTCEGSFSAPGYRLGAANVHKKKLPAHRGSGMSTQPLREEDGAGSEVERKVEKEGGRELPDNLGGGRS